VIPAEAEEESFVYRRHFGPLDLSGRHHLGRLDRVRHLFISIKNRIASFFARAFRLFKQPVISCQPVQESQTPEEEGHDSSAFEPSESFDMLDSMMQQWREMGDFQYGCSEEEEDCGLQDGHASDITYELFPGDNKDEQLGSDSKATGEQSHVNKVVSDREDGQDRGIGD